jgi:hypothetical protein
LRHCCVQVFKNVVDRDANSFLTVRRNLAVNCCDENVIVPCSERIRLDQNVSELISGKRLKNHVEWRIFITDQNTLGDLQNRRAADNAVNVDPFPRFRRFCFSTDSRVRLNWNLTGPSSKSVANMALRSSAHARRHTFGTLPRRQCWIHQVSGYKAADRPSVHRWRVGDTIRRQWPSTPGGAIVLMWFQLLWRRSHKKRAAFASCCAC